MEAGGGGAVVEQTLEHMWSCLIPAEVLLEDITRNGWYWRKNAGSDGGGGGGGLQEVLPGNDGSNNSGGGNSNASKTGRNVSRWKVWWFRR